jgi:hypothetical protein
VKEALTQEMILLSSIYGFCIMVNWVLSKYAAKADLHAAVGRGGIVVDSRCLTRGSMRKIGGALWKSIT